MNSVRVWTVNIIFGDVRIFRVCLRYLETGDKSEFAALDDDPLPLSSPAGEDPVEELYRFTDLTFDRWDAGEITAQQAAARVFDLLGRTPLPPIHAWGDPAAHHLDLLPAKLVQMHGWGQTAPWPLNRWFDFDLAMLDKLEAEKRQQSAPARAKGPR